jgi:hypothetical protein
VEELPQRIAAEKEAALTEATRQVTAHYEQQLLILQKDAESERKVATLQVAALQETLKRQVQDIALKAITLSVHICWKPVSGGRGSGSRNDHR